MMPKEKCSDCEQFKLYKEVLLSSEALKPKLDRCLKVICTADFKPKSVVITLTNHKRCIVDNHMSQSERKAKHAGGVCAGNVCEQVSVTFEKRARIVFRQSVRIAM